MKTFEFFWYDEKSCPLAYKIENTINTCGSPKSHLEEIQKYLTIPDLWRFMLACILYWADAERWDDRNKYAVFASKQIVKHFPNLSKTTIPDETLKEAYGFTKSAHRYLQNEFFETIEEYLKQNDTMGIMNWFEGEEFVYNDTNDGLIPYKTYRMQKYGVA